MLIGRESECELLDELLHRARMGRSGALVVRGEAGIGKTSLLEHAVERGHDMTVVRATGIESESEIEFSGLLELCRPLLDLLDALPERQAAALRGTLGLGESVAGDPFVVGAGTLSLLAAAGEARPLLVVVDDAQWLDRASANAVRFAARRLDADRVCLLFAVREDEPATVDWAGFDEIRLSGLDLEDARTLVRESTGLAVPEEVVVQLHESTRGSPLALRELPSLLEPSQLDGTAPINEPLPAGDSVRRAFARRAEHLPEGARRALGLVAVASSTDLAPIASALQRVGLGVSALEPAEDAGLVTIAAGEVRFCHPLVRAAVHEASPGSVRREAHAALAAAYEELGEPDRSARHLAVGTLGHDETAAAAVAAAAERARGRTAYAAASEAFELAARISPPGEARWERLAEAAEAAWHAGTFERSLALARDALAATADPLLRARLLMAQGRVELTAGTHPRARELFLEAAELFASADPARAVSAIDLAAWVCDFEGDVRYALELARGARDVDIAPGSHAELHADYVLGRSLVRAGDRVEGVALLERAVEGLLEGAQPTRVDFVWAATSLWWLERLEQSVALVERITAQAREDGPTALVYALGQSGHIRGRAGDWDRAAADSAEAAALARALALPNMVASGLSNLARVEARRGEEPSCRAHVEEAVPVLEAAGMVASCLQLSCVLGLLELGLDQLEDAVATLGAAADDVDRMGIADRDLTPVPDLVEALVRLGEPDEARERLDAWAGTRVVATSPWAPQLEQRCRGLLAADDEFDAPFDAALRLHGDWDDPFARARTLLCYGERLRRAGRRRDAREQLREADVVFDRLGAKPWSDRARRELRASGERLRRRESVEAEQLTPQELQIALQVAEGKTNKDVGAALFLSHKTVEFHLSRIYRKLDLNSRAELIRRFATQGAAEVATAGP